MSDITEQLLRGTSKGVGAKAALALEDGTVFFGAACGAAGEAFGEICFNTSLEGYLEVISDPSYAGQIITLTYPQIGKLRREPRGRAIGQASTARARGSRYVRNAEQLAQRYGAWRIP